MTAATCHPEKASWARGLCKSCYSRALYHGEQTNYPLRTKLPPHRCACGKEIARSHKRCVECFHLPRWFCECEGTDHDALGECARCGRITIEAVEKSLAKR